MGGILYDDIMREGRNVILDLVLASVVLAMTLQTLKRVTH